MSRRAAWTLIALCAWTLWVWITRVWIIAGQDQSMGFKVVHGILAAGSIAFGLAAGWIGYRGLRPAPPSILSADSADREAPPVSERSTTS
jgi:type VI protein secretion system component VasK